MNVKCAKEHIEQITAVCNEINAFDLKHAELQDEIGFLCDAVAFLGDYRKVLERAIDKAELDI